MRINMIALNVLASQNSCKLSNLKFCNKNGLLSNWYQSDWHDSFLVYQTCSLIIILNYSIYKKRRWGMNTNETIVHPSSYELDVSNYRQKMRKNHAWNVSKRNQSKKQEKAQCHQCFVSSMQ